jgi:hypothetical protein
LRRRRELRMSCNAFPRRHASVGRLGASGMTTSPSATFASSNNLKSVGAPRRPHARCRRHRGPRPPRRLAACNTIRKQYRVVKARAADFAPQLKQLCRLSPPLFAASIEEVTQTSSALRAAGGGFAGD